ncbi:MAG: GAF domain-containing protein [Chloroflexota bacterium]|nr:GAF domain-containing protein [Chloroflexota bacterium]
MSSGSQWLSRPSSPGPSGPLRAADAGARQAPARGFSDLDEVNTCCQEALDGALELVRADGGEVAILDSEGAAVVTRARRKRPPRMPGFGSPSRPSQPINQIVTTEPLDPFDSQVTQLLPSAQMSRAYAPDQGLIGEVWKRREPMNVRLDEHTAAADATMLVEADARNHLAVPIFRPDELSHLGGRGTVIGVLRVFNRDPLWPYSNNDRMLLELHADRLGRTLAMLEPSVVNVRRSDLVTALRALASVGASRRDLLERAGEIALRQINAFSFTALAYNSRNERASVDMATRTVAAPDGEMAVTDLPPWLQRAVRGDFVRESAPQGGSPGALAWLGWSQATPIRSALAAPLRTGGHTFEVIVATSPQIDAFTDDAAVLFEALSLGLATFVDNANQVEKARRSVEQVSALNNSVQALNSTLDLKATLQQLAEQASLVSNKRACAVFLRAEGADELICRAVYPHEIEQRSALLDATIPLTWQSIDERLKNSTYVLVDELTGGEPDSATAKLARIGVSGCCATPIVREGVDDERERDLGALITFNTGPMKGYLPEEHILLNGLASQAASAIGNARVYAQLQQAYAQLQELDRLKDDFILTVSHEFRTPLTAI